MKAKLSHPFLVIESKVNPDTKKSKERKERFQTIEQAREQATLMLKSGAEWAIIIDSKINKRIDLI